MSETCYSSKVGMLKHVQQHESGSLFEKGRQYGVDEAQYIAKRADEEIRQLRERAERAEQLLEDRRWISVDERLPELDVEVFAYSPDYGFTVCWRKEQLDGIVWATEVGFVIHPTNWTPLPAAPDTQEG